ncbi:SAF domain-containing protein [Luteococcus sp. Sow4_B9]|uniref:SAF domain-containing protein n=1 Tax=Luteococcus sp. Sow4_B9 TaxID=3438792 RepID=UPI003F9731BB
MRISDSWAALARAVRWHRRSLAAVTAALATLLTIQAISPPAPDGTDVVVAARELAAGSTITAADLRVVSYPPQLAPEGAATATESLVGRVLTATAPPGMPLTDSSLLSTNQPVDGEMLVPFGISDAGILALVQPGDRITVVGPGADGQVQTLAKRVRVVTTPQRQSDALGGTGNPLLVVACDPATASRLAAAAASQPLGIALG